MDYQQLIDTYADLAKEFGEKYQLRDTLVLADIRQESSGVPTKVSYCGAVGLMQVMDPALIDYNEFHLTKYTLRDILPYPADANKLDTKSERGIWLD
jgi:hypothetical protein